MANTTEADWDEASPAISDPRRDGAAEITALRKAVRLRLSREHVTLAGTSAGGEHKEGSAKVYYEASAPTLRPDGTTALSSDDAGRLWVNSTTKEVQVWNGTTWVAIDATLAADIDGFETLDGGVWAGGPLTETGLAAGTYRVTIDGTTQNSDGTTSFTISVTVNGTTRNMTIDNAPDGTAPFSLSLFVTVTGAGTCSLTAASGVYRIRSMTGFRTA